MSEYTITLSFLLKRKKKNEIGYSSSIIKKHIKGYKHILREFTLKRWATRKLQETTKKCKSPIITVIQKFNVPKKNEAFLCNLAAHKSLNTQQRLQRKLSHVYFSFSLLPVFEGIEHLFFRFPSASWCWDLLRRVFDFCVRRPDVIEDWLLEALNGWNLKGNHKILWGCGLLEFVADIWKKEIGES